MNKKLTFLLSLTFLVLFSCSVYGGVLEDFQSGLDAHQRKDYKEAVRLMLPIAEQGYAEAQNNLGWMCNHGQGIPQDFKEAVKWYRLSAEQGFAMAQSNLGRIYLSGQGVSQDFKEAVKWYRLSAEQGNAKAQLNLGWLYDNGQGVLQDYALAHMWFNLCGSSGDQACVGNRSIIEKKMSPSQVEKAQEMAKNWKPTKK
jgi:TPR repeat protein